MPFFRLPLLAISLSLMITACQPDAPATDHPPAADPTREPILASELLLRHSSPELTFYWSAPPEAALEPNLFRLLRSDAEQALQTAEAEARKSASDAKTGGYEFHGNEFHQNWKPEAETPTLLVLSAQTSTYTGGAHGNMGYDAAIYDRKAGKRISFADLFTSPSDALKALTPAWCQALDAERAERRGKDKLPDFSDCPPLGDQVIVPAGEGQISLLRVLVAPYVAGPWAEGSYEVSLPLDSIRTMVKTAYQKDFAPS